MEEEKQPAEEQRPEESNAYASVVIDEHLPIVRRQMMDARVEEAPPPPYPKERWWKKYRGAKNAYCCTEFFCRLSCIPCSFVGCLTGIGLNILQPFVCCYTEERGRRLDCRCPTSAELKPAWCLYTELDSALDWWPVCCIGTLRFPEERSADEKKRIQQCDECCDSCITCPLRWCNSCCDAFCNSKCMLKLKSCMSSCSISTCNCVCGCVTFCELVGRRLCCIHPQRQEMN